MSSLPKTWAIVKNSDSDHGSRTWRSAIESFCSNLIKSALLSIIFTVTFPIVRLLWVTWKVEKSIEAWSKNRSRALCVAFLDTKWAISCLSFHHRQQKLTVEWKMSDILMSIDNDVLSIIFSDQNLTSVIRQTLK